MFFKKNYFFVGDHSCAWASFFAITLFGYFKHQELTLIWSAMRWYCLEGNVPFNRTSAFIRFLEKRTLNLKDVVNLRKPIPFLCNVFLQKNGATCDDVDTFISATVMYISCLPFLLYHKWNMYYFHLRTNNILMIKSQIFTTFRCLYYSILAEIITYRLNNYTFTTRAGDQGSSSNKS